MHHQFSSNGVLNAGEELGSSPTAPAYRLILQGDGNLVVYNFSGKAVWNSHTAHTGSHNRLVMQGDGNLVLYTSSGKAVWNSGTRKATHLAMQSNGNLVLYNSSNKAVWSSFTGKISYSTYAHFYAGHTLHTNQTLGSGSANPAYKLILQGDGNLVVYKRSGKAKWQSRTARTGSGNRLVLQGDGNLVLYKHRHALWNSHTAHTGSHNRLVMQGDGNLVLYTSSGKAVWSSFTGRIH